MSFDIPTILTVFGATGDLMKRKIVPSLHHLHVNGHLPARTAIVGFSRRDWSDERFREEIRETLLASPAYHGDAADDLDAFLALFRFCGGDFDHAEGFDRLGAITAEIDDEWGVCSNRVFYLAVRPEDYTRLFNRMADAGLTAGCGGAQGWTRMLIEKPFGSDGASAAALEELFAQHFTEEQLYRIDHYLAKEMLQGLMDFRFGNRLLEASWNAEHIESIEIDLLEEIGAEKRGAFYDAVGAFRDVGENHCLAMLALLTMERPGSIDPAAVRAARAELLERLRPLSPAEVARDTFRAQYDGFRTIDGVADDSNTETYAKVRFFIDDPRWSGVPVVMQAGKRTGPPLKRMVVNFRKPHECLCEGHTERANRVVFQLEPEDRIAIEFWTKKPGLDRDQELRTFDFFLYERTEKAQYVEEYAKLIFDAIRGDQRLFVSRDEVAAQWAFADPIVDTWREANVPPLARYAPDTREAVDEAASLGTAPPEPDGTYAGGIPADSPALRREIGVWGLGRMGQGVALNLVDHDWRVVGLNRTASVTEGLVDRGIMPSFSVEEFVASLPRPRLIWLMLPSGHLLDSLLFDEGGLIEHLEPGDFVVDGGNSYFRDTVARAERIAPTGIRFLDCGTSGGPGGARTGACLMIGGERADYEALLPLWRDLSVTDGYRFFEGHGAGHFVKMVHNGIEYGMMQAIAEGFAIMRASDYDLDLTAVAEVYNHGSVVTSRLVGWLHDAFVIRGQELEGVSGSVGHTGEGAWTAKTGEELGVEARIIAESVRFRLDSDDNPSYTGKALQAMRAQFGGHNPAGQGDPLTGR